ncbi:MAG TPA: DUF6448 family protein [Solirubrobacterales bacterium]|nr:DUF6448 family protein [Solirubrobacterales bacterium]
MKYRFALAAIAAMAVGPLAARNALAHCDTLDGPVVMDARAALEARDVMPVLKWVGPAKEGEIREAFQHALEVRALGPEARALADRFFFETLVRFHREGEGAPYAGLKPAGTEVDPGIAAADEALATGSVDRLAKLLSTTVDKGLRERFVRAAEARAHASEGVDQGRAYVAAYVAFTHYAERLHSDARGGASEAAHGASPGAGSQEHRH